jgi:hypothetical protein
MARSTVRPYSQIRTSETGTVSRTASKTYRNKIAGAVPFSAFLLCRCSQDHSSWNRCCSRRGLVLGCVQREGLVTATAASGHWRARRFLVFLAVVWSIGAAFLALEAGMTELSWFSSSRSLPANMVLPKQSQAAFAHCQEVVKSLPPPAQNVHIESQASYLVWKLGYMLGTADGSLTSGTANRAAVESVLRQSLPATSALAIPPVALPEHGRSAYALREFSVFLEEDTPCVAAALQFRRSPRHAALYKFGAAVGFASIYRRLAPGLGDVFAPEVRIYGSAAGIPAELYAPLLGQPVPSGSGADTAQAFQSAVNRIDAYIKTSN